MRWLAVLALALAACGGKTDPPRDDATMLPSDSGSSANPCAACTIGQVCVQRFDGTCGMAVTCVTTGESCPVNTCSAACEAALCPQPYQCQTRPACGSEVVGAFTCYGP